MAASPVLLMDLPSAPLRPPGRTESLLRDSGAIMLSGMTDVTRILSAIEQGNPAAAEQLRPAQQ